MGLFNEVKSLITIKADASQAKQEVRELSGVEKQAAKERLAAIEGQNKKLEGSIATYAKAAGALTAVGVAGKIAFDAIEFSGRRADLQAAAGSVSIDRLRKATLGLRTDTQLLELAGKLNHAQVKLTAEQMDLAGRAATALAERGGDAEEAFEAVTTALVTGRTRGLAPFGIQIDETKDKAEKFTSLMRELGKVQGEVSEATLDASDKVGQQRVKFANAFATVQDGIGKIASEMLPLLETLTAIGGVAAGLVGGVDSALSGIGRIAKYGIPVYGQVLLVKDAVSGNVTDIAASYLSSSTGGLVSAFHAGRALGTGGLTVKPPGDIEMPMSFVGRVPKGKGGRGVSARDVGSDLGGAGFEDVLRQMAADSATYDDLTDQEFGGGLSVKDAMAARSKERQDAVAGDIAKMREGMAFAAAEWKDKPSLLDSMFGDNGAINAKAEALNLLTGAATAGFEAMVDGSMSAGEAMKRSIADGLKALGSKMLVLGIGETAAGFAAIASGYGFGAAAPHFKAAALYSAGAVAAGLAANAIGTSAGASAGGGASPTAPDSRGSSASGNGGSTDRIIVYDDAFAENNAHERRLRAEKLVRRVTGSGAVRSN